MDSPFPNQSPQEDQEIKMMREKAVQRVSICQMQNITATRCAVTCHCISIYNRFSWECRGGRKKQWRWVPRSIPSLQLKIIQKRCHPRELDWIIGERSDRKGIQVMKMKWGKPSPSIQWKGPALSAMIALMCSTSPPI